MVVRQWLRRRDDLMQVRVHQLVHDVNVVEAVDRGGAQDVLDADDVLVVEVAQNLDLAKRALRVSQMVERLVDLLDRNFLAGFVVEC